MSELLDIKQVQQILKVSERTVFNLLKRGDLNGFKSGREWRFEQADIDNFIRRQREKVDKQKKQVNH